MAYAPSVSTFPTAKTGLVDPSATSDTGTFDHAGLEAAQNSAIKKLEDAVGITSSSDTDSINYKLTSTSQSNPGHKHTLVNGASNVTATYTELNYLSGKTMSGADTTIITGTKGTSADLAVWNADGDLVDGPTPPSGTILGTTDTQTLTNKRITPRVVTATDDATAVIDCDVTDQYQLTAIASATEFTVTGTPVNGQKLIIRLKDAGVGKGLTWTGFTAIGVTLPTTTVANKTHYIGCIYNSAASTWDAVAVIVQS